MPEDLIPRSAVKEALKKVKLKAKLLFGSGYVTSRHRTFVILSEALDAIDEMPTVDAEPVRHGRWSGDEISPGFPTLNGYCCTNCGRRAGRKTNYCPDCGAKMDEGVQ